VGALRFFMKACPLDLRSALPRPRARYFVSISLSLTTARYSALYRRLKRARARGLYPRSDLGRSLKRRFSSIFPFFFSSSRKSHEAIDFGTKRDDTAQLRE